MQQNFRTITIKSFTDRTGSILIFNICIVNMGFRKKVNRIRTSRVVVLHYRNGFNTFACRWFFLFFRKKILSSNEKEENKAIHMKYATNRTFILQIGSECGSADEKFTWQKWNQSSNRYRVAANAAIAGTIKIEPNSMLSRVWVAWVICSPQRSYAGCIWLNIQFDCCYFRLFLNSLNELYVFYSSFFGWYIILMLFFQSNKNYGKMLKNTPRANIEKCLILTFLYLISPLNGQIFSKIVAT